MKFKLYKLTLFSIIYSKILFAQSLSQEIPVQTSPLQGVGVQRVGSVPLPIPTQNIEMMAAPSVTIQKPQGIVIQPAQISPKKLPYDTTFMMGKIIYLNGVNISTIKNQTLENVNLRIDNNGNIYIDAPQYEIGVEQSYHPLMPNELPKFPKSELQDSNLTKGTYSKETGKFSIKPPMPSEFAPEIPIKEQTQMSNPSKNDGNSQKDSAIQNNNSDQVQSSQPINKDDLKK